MGTVITLDVGGLTVDWSKNARGNDHGMLFQEKDRKPFPGDQIDYEYHGHQGLDPTPVEVAFSRPLRDVVPRLELLGFCVNHVRREYAARVAAWRDENREKDDELAPLSAAMTFEEFCDFVSAYPLLDLDDTFIDEYGPNAQERIRGTFKDEKTIARIPRSHGWDDTAWSERSYFGTLINILHPYSVLRLLALNEANLAADVEWQYGPLVESGWAHESEFVPNARRTQTFLIATEGSSDVHILKHAFTLLRPEVADFFRFIDVSERHPFSGAGGLLRFAEGLAKIDVQNQVVFLFDNDAEGFETYQKVLQMNLPPNMTAMILPELEEFRTFSARGPDGVRNANINRRAAAIECYLDLRLEGRPPAQVTWTNYKEELGVYQGALDFKESYIDQFLRQDATSIAAGSYDASKLTAVLDALIGECSAMAMKALPVRYRQGDV